MLPSSSNTLLSQRGPNGRLSWRMAIALPVVAGFVGMSLSLAMQHGAVAARNADSIVAPSYVVSVPRGAQGASVGERKQSARLVIPTIGVDARIQSVGLAWQGDGTMGIPTNFTDVGWFNQGPSPGEPGSAVIDGHFDGKDVREAVFYRLKELKVGDIAEIVDHAGKTLRFRVVKTALYDYNAPTDEIFSSDTSTARMNLITCGGSWDKSRELYNKRVVVFTQLIPGG